MLVVHGPVVHLKPSTHQPLCDLRCTVADQTYCPFIFSLFRLQRPWLLLFQHEAASKSPHETPTPSAQMMSLGRTFRRICHFPKAVHWAQKYRHPSFPQHRPNPKCQGSAHPVGRRAAFALEAWCNREASGIFPVQHIGSIICSHWLHVKPLLNPIHSLSRVLHFV